MIAIKSTFYDMMSGNCIKVSLKINRGRQMVETLKNCIIYVLNQLTVRTFFPNGWSNFV